MELANSLKRILVVFFILLLLEVVSTPPQNIHMNSENIEPPNNGFNIIFISNDDRNKVSDLARQKWRTLITKEFGQTNLLSKLKNNEVEPTIADYNNLINTHDVARKLGIELDAEIIIWEKKIEENKFSPQITVVKHYDELLSTNISKDAYTSNQSTIYSNESVMTDVFNLTKLIFGIENFYTGNYTVALNHFLRINPEQVSKLAKINKINSLIGCCYLFKTDNEPEIALKYFTHVLRIDSTDAKSLINIGLAYYNMGQYRMAISAYSKALKIYPETSMLYSNMANAYIELEEYNEAIRIVNEAITFDNQNFVLFYNLGTYYFDLMNYEKAIEYFEQTRLLNPDFEKNYSLLGESYFQLRQYSNALDAYEKLSTEIYKKKIYVNMGYAYEHLKEYEKAKECFNTSIENNINAIPAYINIGAIFDLQSKDLQALDAFTKAIQHEDAFVKNENGVIAHPDLKYAYANLGTLYGKHGLFKTQLLYYKKAARLGEKLIQEQLEMNGETW